MKNRKLLSIVVILTITTGAFAFADRIQLAYPALTQLFEIPENNQLISLAKKPKPTSQNSVDKNTEEADQVPDKIIYFVLFNHLVGLKEQAAKASANGKSLDYLQLYKTQGNLSDPETELLFTTAQSCMDAVKQIDKEAKEIIDEARAKFPKGEARSREEIPEAPKELAELQQRKDDTVLKFRDVLQDALGTVKFSEFNSFAQQKIAPQITMDLTKKEEK